MKKHGGGYLLDDDGQNEAMVDVRGGRTVLYGIVNLLINFRAEWRLVSLTCVSHK